WHQGGLRRGRRGYSITAVPRIAATRGSSQETRVHRAVLLGLTGSILGWARPKGGEGLCRRGDLVSERGEGPNRRSQPSFRIERIRRGCYRSLAATRVIEG